MSKYDCILMEHGFHLSQTVQKYNSMGSHWEISEKYGKGIHWLYEQEDLYHIEINDFYLHHDTVVEIDVPPCLCVNYYESLSVEELVPYNKLKPGFVKTFIGGEKRYIINIHKKVPMISVGIEILPAYYEDYLKKNYPEEYQNPLGAFKSFDIDYNFPEMEMLLTQIKNYRGEGISAKLFYDAKVAEAVALIVEHQKNKKEKDKVDLSTYDKQMLTTVTEYINKNYAKEITLKQLAEISCMSISKLKTAFKKMNYCTITEYVQQTRIKYSLDLLENSDLSVKQIAKIVGYKNSSRFSQLFKKFMGILPNEYRKIIKSSKKHTDD